MLSIRENTSQRSRRSSKHERRTPSLNRTKLDVPDIQESPLSNPSLMVTCENMTGINNPREPISLSEEHRQGARLPLFPSNGVVAVMPQTNLTKTQALLYRYLRDNAGRPVSRDELSENIWRQPYSPMSRTIDQTVAQVRKKLPTRKEQIIAVPYIGYRLEKSPSRRD